jgi:outer membrane protein TolC
MFLKKSFIIGLSFISFANAITLQDLINIAKENNPVLKQKSLDIKIQESIEKQAKAKRFGEVDIYGSYNRYEGDRVLYPISVPINPVNLVGAKNQFVAGISYSVPIFTGFQIKNSIEATNLGKKIKEIQYKLTKNEIIYNIKAIYIKILSLQKQKEAFELYDKSLQELYKNINEMVKVGKKPEVDLLKVKYDLENVKSVINEIENNINSLKAALKTLAGKEDIDLSHIEEISFTKNYPQVESFKLITSLDTVKQLLKNLCCFLFH